MKFIILLVVTFFTISVMAENWMRQEDIRIGAVRGFQMQKDCIVNKQVCFDIGNADPSLLMLDVLGNPVIDPVKQAARNQKIADYNAKESSSAARMNALKALKGKDLTADEQKGAVKMFIDQMTD